MLNVIMKDGSRLFGELPMTHLWHELYDHLKALEGTMMTGLISDEVTEAWIDFSYRGNQFSVNNQFGDYWFFVKDPRCPDDVLETILSHCKLLLGEGRL